MAPSPLSRTMTTHPSKARTALTPTSYKRTSLPVAERVACVADLMIPCWVSSPASVARYFWLFHSR